MSADAPEPDVRRAVARAAVGMGVWTAVSRTFGFVRVLVIAAVLGTTYLGNTFGGTNAVSNVLFELLAAGALSAVLVPTFVGLFGRQAVADAERLAGALLGVALVGLGAVALVGMLAAPWLASLLTAGVDDPEVARAQHRLATFLLWFFLPQVVLYAWGAIATAVLHARRRFAVTAAAPIANTVVMVGFLLVFRARVGSDPGLDLGLTDRLLLAAAGTLGVVGFVAVLAIAAGRSGFRLRPRWPRRDPDLARLVRLSSWGVALHSAAGILLGTAIVAGQAVEGGVVAYQVAFVFFLAPYAILAQPIHTAVLPELAADAERGDEVALARSVRWALDRMAWLVVPVSAAAVALAEPIMRVVAFGAATGRGVELLAAGLASLALGLYGYGAFLLLARGYYALGDSRTPAVVAVAGALVGAGVMVVGAVSTTGAARVAALGIGHSTAYLAGAATLAWGLSRRTGEAIVPARLLAILALAAALGAALWGTMRSLAPDGRLATAAAATAVTVLAGALWLVAARRLPGAPAGAGAGR